MTITSDASIDIENNEVTCILCKSYKYDVMLNNKVTGIIRPSSTRHDHINIQFNIVLVFPHEQYLIVSIISYLYT